MTDAGSRECFSQFGLSPKSRCDLIVRFWNEYDTCGTSGAADEGVMQSIEREVTEAMAKTPPDIRMAESLTCKAMLLLTGNTDC